MFIAKLGYDPSDELKGLYSKCEQLATDGGNDPDHSDGENYEQTRRLIAYRKAEMELYLKKEQLPEEFFWQMPPELPRFFMAKRTHWIQLARQYAKQMEANSKYLAIASLDSPIWKKEAASGNYGIYYMIHRLFACHQHLINPLVDEKQVIQFRALTQNGYEQYEREIDRVYEIAMKRGMIKETDRTAAEPADSFDQVMDAILKGEYEQLTVFAFIR